MSILATLVRRITSGISKSHALVAVHEGDVLVSKSDETLTDSICGVSKDYFGGETATSTVNCLQGEYDYHVPFSLFPTSSISPNLFGRNPHLFPPTIPASILPAPILPASFRSAPDDIADNGMVRKLFETVKEKFKVKISGLDVLYPSVCAVALCKAALSDSCYPSSHTCRNALQGMQHSLKELFSRYLYLLKAFPQVLPHDRFLFCTSRLFQPLANHCIKIEKKMGRQRRNPLWADDDEEEDDDDDGSINVVSSSCF